MRPAIDIHYRLDSSEDANLTFILQKPRLLDSESITEQVESFVNNPYFCECIQMLFYMGESFVIDVVFF